MILSNYQPGDFPPQTKLNSDSDTEEVTAWCQTFLVYIKAGKVSKSLDLPFNMVVGHVAKWVEIEFFNTTLRVYIDKNEPEDDPLDNRMSENIVVDLIYHYYSSTMLLYSRITALCLYNHQKDETFDTFQARAERLIAAAYFPVMTADQIAILFHADMMTNRYLKEEVKKILIIYLN